MLNNSQYEYMDEASIDSELICIICNKPLEDPQCAPCDHIFCKGCITEWIRRGNASCPTCRRPLQIHELTQTIRVVRNMLGKLRVKCMTCGKIDLERSDFELHVNTACPTVCLAVDIMCPWRGFRGQLDNHLVSCNYQVLRPVLIPLITECKQLKEQVTQQTTEVEKYKGEVRQLKQQIEKEKTHNYDIGRRINEREMQQRTLIDQNRNKVQELEEQLKREQYENGQDCDKIRHLKEQMAQLQQIHERNISRYVKERETQERNRNDQYQNKVRQLEEQLEKIKQHKTSVEGYQNKIIQLTEQLKQQCVKTDRYETEIKNLKKQIKDQHAQNWNQIQQLKGYEMHYRANIAESNSEIQQLKQQIEDQNIRISELHADHQEQNEQLMSQMDNESEQTSSVWPRLSNFNAAGSSNRTARRHAKKRLTKQRFECR